MSLFIYPEDFILTPEKAKTGENVLTFIFRPFIVTTEKELNMNSKQFNFMIGKINDGFVLRVTCAYGRQLFVDKKHVKFIENDNGENFYIGRDCIIPAGVGLVMATTKELYSFNAFKKEWIKCR